MNRANRRDVIFFNDLDFEAFLRVLRSAMARFRMPLFGFAVMPNHFHMVIQPTADGQLSKFMHWLGTTHTQRWHRDHGTSGSGSLYQGRFKSLPVQTDRHFLTVVRYVERNPVRAGLVDRAEDWRWSSAWHQAQSATSSDVDDWPVPRPVNWREWVNMPHNEAELAAMREAITRSAPFGNAKWTRRIARRLALTHTLRRRGRPRKRPSSR